MNPGGINTSVPTAAKPNTSLQAINNSSDSPQSNPEARPSSRDAVTTSASGKSSGLQLDNMTEETIVLPAAPTLTKAPALSSAPALAKAPALSSAPALTKAPALSSAPALTKAPALSSAPTLSSAPVQAPALTSTPTPAPAAAPAPAPVHQQEEQQKQFVIKHKLGPDSKLTPVISVVENGQSRPATEAEAAEALKLQQQMKDIQRQLRGH